MALPRRLLGDGEDVVVARRRHIKVLTGPILIAVLVVAAAVAASVLWPAGSTQGPARLVISLVALVAVLALLVPKLARWATTSYTLTNRRLITRTGVFNKRGHDIPLARINDVGFDHGLIDRMFGCGTLVIESAGERGQVVLPDVAGVQSMHQALAELLYSGDDGPDRGR